MGSNGQIMMILILAILVCAFFSFAYFLRLKALGGDEKWVKTLMYEIYYMGKCIAKSSVRFTKKKNRFRFGFSDQEVFRNNIVLKKHLLNMEDEACVKHLEQTYGTWFEIKKVGEQIMVAAAYTQEERFKKNKTIYLKDRVLDDRGEFFENEMILYSKGDADENFFIRLYDPYASVD